MKHREMERERRTEIDEYIIEKVINSAYVNVEETDLTVLLRPIEPRVTIDVSALTKRPPPLLAQVFMLATLKP